MSRLLGLDIETAPAMAYVWGLHDQNIGLEQLIQPSRILCWSAKFLGEKKIHYADERGGRKNMLLQIRALISQADGLITYNGDHFDLPRLAGEFVSQRLEPPPPVASIDLFKTARNLGYISGKLAFIAPYLKIGKKVKNEGFPLWSACLNGDAAAWRRMKAYNMQDTELLEGLYEVLKPYIRNHPNVSPDGFGCPACQSTKAQKRGYRRTRGYKIERMQCLGCGSWYDGKRHSLRCAA